MIHTPSRGASQRPEQQPEPQSSSGHDRCSYATSWDAIAKDAMSWVRQTVAKNPSTPAGALEALAKDKDAGVRQTVARNPSTPAGALEALAKDKDAEVRQYVAKTPRRP